MGICIDNMFKDISGIDVSVNLAEDKRFFCNTTEAEQ